jgi:hypothetical protein
MLKIKNDVRGMLCGSCAHLKKEIFQQVDPQWKRANLRLVAFLQEAS